ncbi:hypothetical protein QS257_08830 [Terrilactibacillus sp. S3-3]|nr:hypothetical protein QS257_08830 [Terrilactibacillus sp. S3-3]
MKRFDSEEDHHIYEVMVAKKKDGSQECSSIASGIDDGARFVDKETACFLEKMASRRE